jgi:hypothetical protein
MHLRDLFETDFPIPRENKFITPAYVNRLLKTKQWSRHGSTLDEWIIDMENYDPNFPFDKNLQPAAIFKDPRFPDYLKKWLPKRYNFVVTQLRTELNSVRTGENLKLRRFLRVPQKWLSQFQNGNAKLGIYWSADFSDIHEGNAPEEGVEVLITGLVPISSVNWQQTLVSRFDYYSGDREGEVQLIPGTPIQIIDAWIDDKKLKPTRFKNRKYFA